MEEVQMQQQQQQPEQMMTPMYQQQQLPQPPMMMMQPMEGSYTAYAPPRVDTNVSMDTSSNMGDELQSPMGAASP